MNANSGQQPSWLNDLVRIGGDRAIIGPTNWAAMSHQQLYDAVCGNNDPGVVLDVSDRWTALGSTMLESADTLHQHVMNTTSGWEGDAAESARNAVIQLVDWGGKASQTAQFMGHQLNQQGQVMATAKANMPQPQPFDLNRATAVAPGMAGFNNSLVDQQAAAQAADEAHARAIDVARAMESASVPIDTATPDFEPVPTVRKKAALTSAAPLMSTAGPALRPATAAGPMAGQPQQATTSTQPAAGGNPSSAAPIQPAGPAGQPGPGVPAGQPGSAAPAGMAPVSGQPGPAQPVGMTTTSAYAPAPAPLVGPGGVGGPGGFVPSMGGGPAPAGPVSTGYPMPGGPSLMPSWADGPPPPGRGLPAMPGGSRRGDWTGANPVSEGGGPEGMPGPGGLSVPLGGEGFAAGGGARSGGVGSGSGAVRTTGMGSAAEAEYRPGTINSRLGSGSGGAGAGSSAAAAESAAERAGVGRAGAGEPGAAAGMPGGRGGRKEDDKEHKSAGYVHGDDDIFEPLGGDLAPPVIGERRPKQQK